MVKKHKDEALQKLVRGYLKKLEYLAYKHGLSLFVKSTIKANKRGDCKATRHEADMLARMVDEDRLFREEIPSILGKSYRKCVDNDLFSSIGRLKSKGRYSKIDVMILKEKDNG